MKQTDRSVADRPAIITPIVDAFCCGGFSILLIGGFIVYVLFFPPAWETFQLSIAGIVIAGALINFPHFMASYRLLYTSVENVRRYPGASLYVPAILLGILVYAVLTADDNRFAGYANEEIAYLLPLIASFYLAWHYTGQAWGMTASFSYMGGMRMNKWERILIRSGSRVLLAFHVIWVTRFVSTQPMPDDWRERVAPWLDTIDQLYNGLIALALVSLFLGLFGFWACSRRTSQFPPIRAVLPWIALYLWYLLIHIEPKAFFLLQVSHALQYLIFPMRVELNRYAEKATKKRVARPIRHMLVYYVALFICGQVVLELPYLLVFVGDPQQQLAAVITGSVCIHHYFVDGCVWKISNPTVRRELFAHLHSD